MLERRPYISYRIDGSAIDLEDNVVLIYARVSGRATRVDLGHDHALGAGFEAQLLGDRRRNRLEAQSQLAALVLETWAIPVLVIAGRVVLLRTAQVELIQFCGQFLLF